MNKRFFPALAAAVVVLSSGLLWFTLPLLTFTPTLDLNLSDREVYEKALEVERDLKMTQPVVLLFDSSGLNMDDAGKLYLDLVSKVEKLKEWTASGAWNTILPRSDGNEIWDVPLWQKESGYPLGPYDRLFWSPDYILWKIYLQPEDKESPGWVELDQLLEDRRLSVAGDIWNDRKVLAAMYRDMSLLIPLSLVLLLGILYLISRNILASVVLALSSIVPAMGSLIPFGFFGRALTYGSLVAPFLVMAISTTYTIHVWHHHQQHGYGLRRLLLERGRPLAWAGGTTVLGFLTMMVTPVEEIRWLGAAMLTGLFWIFTWVLGVLPQALRWLVPHQTKTGSRIALSGTEPAMKKNKGWPGFIIPGVLGVTFLFILTGLGSVTTGLTWEDLFRKDDPSATALQLLSSHGDTLEPWILSGEAEEEGWWLTPEAFRDMRTWKAGLPIATLAGLWDTSLVLEAVNQAWGGPEFDSAEGEISVEMLAELAELIPRDNGLPEVINRTGNRITMYFFEPPAGPEVSRSFRDAVLRELNEIFPGVRWSWAGSRFRRDMSNSAYAEGQVAGLMLEFGFLFLVVIFGVKKKPRLIGVPLVPVLSVLFLLGLSGLLGWRITPAMSLILAGIAGVSIDDALLWVFLGAQPSIRTAVVQTTGILSVLIATLMLSVTPIMSQLAVLTVCTLVFSSLVVLFILPWKKSEY